MTPLCTGANQLHLQQKEQTQYVCAKDKGAIGLSWASHQLTPEIRLMIDAGVVD